MISLLAQQALQSAKETVNFLEILQKIIYLSNTFISSNPIFIHHNYFQRIIFQFFHRNVKFKLLVKLGIQCILFNRSFLFFCPLTTIMEPNFCIRILKLYWGSVSASVASASAHRIRFRNMIWPIRECHKSEVTRMNS